MRAARNKRRAVAVPSVRGAFIWLAVSLVVFAFLPGMMSGNYLPKIFWTTVMVGIGLSLQPPRIAGVLSLSRLGAVWAAYLGWALLSLAWALQPRVGFERWLVMIVLTLAYLLAGRTRFWESGVFWRGFALITALVAAIGVLQYYFPGFSPVTYFPGTAIPRGTMGHRNYAGMYFMVTIPFLARYYFSGRGRDTLLAFISLLLAAGFLLLVKSRGAWLGLVVAGIFFLAGGGGRKLIRRSRRTACLGGSLAAAVVFVLAVRPPEPVAMMMAGKADLVGTARALLDPENRLMMWRDVPGVTHPLLGAGFGNFPIVATPFDRDGKVKTLNWEVHNDYLQAYVDLGLPGAVLFIGVFLLLIRQAWRGREGGMILAAGAAVVGLAVMQFTVFTMEVVSTQVWIAGVAAILNRQEGLRPIKETRLPAKMVPAANYLAAVLLLLLAVVIARTIRGDREFRRAQVEAGRVLAYQEMLREGEGLSDDVLNRVRGALETARIRLRIRLEHLADRVLPTLLFDSNMRHITCHQFAGLAWSLQEYSLAEKFARRALELHPHDRVALTHLAAISLREGRLETGYRYLKQGVEIFGCNPYHAFFCHHLAQFHRARGDSAGAEAIEEEMAANVVSPPAHPRPANLERNTPSRLRLEWEGSPAAESYDVYIWSTGESAPDKPRFSGLRENRLRREIDLQPGTTYIWRVRSVGRYGEELGDPWIFRTADNIGRN